MKKATMYTFVIDDRGKAVYLCPTQGKFLKTNTRTCRYYYNFNTYEDAEYNPCDIVPTPNFSVGTSICPLGTGSAISNYGIRMLVPAEVSS